MADITVTVTEEAPVVVNLDEGGSVTGGVIRDRLDALTVSTVLLAATAATLASELVDTFGSVTWRVQLTKSDGSRIVAEVRAWHDGTASADAVNPYWTTRRGSSHADLTDLSVDLNGSAGSQTIRLRCTMALAGWTASVTRQFHKAA